MSAFKKTPLPTFFVKAEWDEEAEVWYVAQTDIPGLNAEADTPEDLIKLLPDLIPELMAANGVLNDGDSMPPVPYSLLFDRLCAGRDCH